MATLSQFGFLVPGRARSGVRAEATRDRSLKVGADGAELVCSLKDRSDGSRNAGLRIVIDPQHRSLSMSLADAHPDDQVVTAYGAHVFLSAAAAKRLRGCTLRAGTAQSGSMFYLERSVAARSMASR